MQSLRIPGLDNIPQFDLGREPLVGPIFRPIEKAFMAVGMNTPSKRLAGVALATGAILYALKPSQFFLNGKARPWSMWSHDAAQTDPPVPVPWWMASVLAGLGAAVFL